MVKQAAVRTREGEVEDAREAGGRAVVAAGVAAAGASRRRADLLPMDNVSQWTL